MSDEATELEYAIPQTVHVIYQYPSMDGAYAALAVYASLKATKYEETRHAESGRWCNVLWYPVRRDGGKCLDERVQSCRVAMGAADFAPGDHVYMLGVGERDVAFVRTVASTVTRGKAHGRVVVIGHCDVGGPDRGLPVASGGAVTAIFSNAHATSAMTAAYMVGTSEGSEAITMCQDAPEWTALFPDRIFGNSYDGAVHRRSITAAFTLVSHRALWSGNADEHSRARCFAVAMACHGPSLDALHNTSLFNKLLHIPVETYVLWGKTISEIQDRIHRDAMVETSMVQIPTKDFSPSDGIVHGSTRVPAVIMTEKHVTDDGISYDASELGMRMAAESHNAGGSDAAAVVRKYQGQARVSLRSLGRVNVGAVARAFGGDGHTNAAGFSVPWKTWASWYEDSS